MAARGLSGGKIDRHSRVRTPIRQHVVSRAAVEPIGANAALEVVVAFVADKMVIVRRALDVLEAGN